MMMRFFREQKFLAVLLALSALVILAGLIMVQYSNKTAAEATAVAVDDKSLQQTVDTMHVIAEIAQQELQQSNTSPASEHKIEDVKPQASLDHVAALNGRTPDVGGEDWCEVMMVKDADAWTKEEQEIFAQHCL